MAWSVGFSLVAAFLFAAAAALQYRAARRAVHGRSDASAAHGLIRRLVRDPVWLTGWGVNLAGFCAQAVALHFGSTAIVQPLLVSQLVFTIVLGTVGTGRRPARLDLLGGLAVSAGLAVLFTVPGAIPPEGEPSRPRILLAGLIAAPAVVVLSRAAWLRAGPVRAALLGVCAGLCFAATAVLIKLTTADLVDRGVAATAVDWPGYALAGSTLLGLVLEQRAFAAGSLPAAMTAMTMTNPIASYLVAALAFETLPPRTAAAFTAVSFSVLLLTGGVALLSRSAHAARGRDDPPTLPA
ncbi:DMT family transporter [Actinomadura sp. NAK00032]|uniref:DMT family transporter n=1 Tax=Actinomadura sp. NAK00032 TaxID=2742128 RepID=UPI001590FAE6|nr:DMT family transporter [Actinomadura sp. NAK00032]QKW35997.1 DMT family transporter [Actinomadura sp. NAK00032]